MKCVSQISCLLAAIACLTADLANAADRTHEEKAITFGQRSPRADQYYGYQQQQSSYSRCPPTFELQIVYQAGGRYLACGCPAGTFQAWVGYGRTACVPNAQAAGKQLTPTPQAKPAAKPTAGQAGASDKNSKVIMSEASTEEEQAAAAQVPQDDAASPDAEAAAVAESRMLSEDTQQVASLSLDANQVADDEASADEDESRENKGAMVAVAVLSCIAIVMLIVVVIGSVMVVRRKRVYTVGGLPPHIRQAPTYHKYPEPLQYFHDEDLVCPESPMYSPHTVV